MAILCYTGSNIENRVSYTNCHSQSLLSILQQSNSHKQSQRISEALYDFKWYLLPAHDQKAVMLMLSNMQNGYCISIGPFEKLNFETLKIVRKNLF